MKDFRFKEMTYKKVFNIIKEIKQDIGMNNKRLKMTRHITL